MVHGRGLWILVAGMMMAPPATAQTPARFRWQLGQVLSYRAEQVTTEKETVGETTAESSLKLRHVKRWQVLAVDSAGVATVQQSLTALRIERKNASGTVAVFDSTQPEQSDPGMREQLSRYVNTPLAVLRIDSLGRVVEVKESKHVPASRYENELPFQIVLPANELQPNHVWERQYTLVLEPPLGTGEKFAAVQKYGCREISGGMATIAFVTAIQNMPEAVGDQVPLLQFEPRGEAIFDLQLGCVRRARWTVDREVKGHQGEESSYRLQSSYTEELVEGR
jgi:hypothetical protein